MYICCVLAIKEKCILPTSPHMDSQHQEMPNMPYLPLSFPSPKQVSDTITQVSYDHRSYECNFITAMIIAYLISNPQFTI